MAYQRFIEGVQLYEDGVEEYFVEGVQANENVSSAGAYTLTADAGAFVLAGQAAGLLVNRSLLSAQGSFVLSGVDSGLLHSNVLVSAQGSYALSLNSAVLYPSLTFGVFALSGVDASLLHSGVLLSDIGAYNLLGSDATLIGPGVVITAEPGAFLEDGFASDLTYARLLLADGDDFLWTGISTQFLRTLIFVSDSAAFTYTGQNATLIYAGAVGWAWGLTHVELAYRSWVDVARPYQGITRVEVVYPERTLSQAAYSSAIQVNERWE